MLIGGCGKNLSVFLQGLKETGADPGEFANVESKDVSKENRAITINHPVKGHRPRILTVSQELINRLEPFMAKLEGYSMTKCFAEHFYINDGQWFKNSQTLDSKT
jgi:integrase